MSIHDYIINNNSKMLSYFGSNCDHCLGYPPKLNYLKDTNPGLIFKTGVDI